MIDRMHAWRELLRHYRRTFSHAWSRRASMDATPRLDHELAFLPATLELVERPVHPAPRWTMMILSATIIATALIATIGQLDIVVTSHGRLIPGVRVKVVQPAVTGVVRHILVRDGQRVREGDLLMDLDPTQASADADKTHAGRLAAAIAQARALALIEAQQHKHAPRVAAIDSGSTDDLASAQRQADGTYAAYRDRLLAAEATLRQREAELETVRAQLDKLRSTAPLARQQASNYKGLVDRKYVTETEYLDKESAALQQEHDLVTQNSRASELAEAIAAQHAEVASINSQFTHEQLDELDKSRQNLAQSTSDETKAVQRRSLMELRAPSDGTVQQLAVHTLGAVVSTAQSVMEIVPDDALEVEAVIENKDIGFVRVGQPVSVKLDAFPYTRYGTLEGTVTQVATDAVSDRKSGLSFVAHVLLPANHMLAAGRSIALTPGMTATAEIKTGRRSVAAFLFDPLVQTAQESLHER